MKTHDELRVFCEGYLEGALRQTKDLSDVDDWVTWGGYYINLFGSSLSADIDKTTDLWVDVYIDQRDMTKLGETEVTFLLQGEQ